MDERAAALTAERHRFPPAIIGHAVWRCVRFALSCRDGEELRAERGVLVTYGTSRRWCRKAGQPCASELRRRRPRPGDAWPLGEVLVSSTCGARPIRTAPCWRFWCSRGATRQRR